MFDLQFNQQRVLNKRDVDDTTISEAISSIYECYDNDLKIIWNDLSFVLDFNSDISIIFNDLLYMIEDLNNNLSEFNTTFLSSSFTAKWSFKRNLDNLTVTPSIYQGHVLKNGEFFEQSDLESIDSLLQTNATDFIMPWIKLVKVLKSDILTAGYPMSIDGMELINKVLSSSNHLI